MLTREQLEQLMKSQSLEELFHALRGTPYEPMLEIYDETGDVQRLELWLFTRNIELHQEVARLLKGVHADAVLAMTRKLEVENLKGAIRLWFSNTIKQQNIDYRFGYLYQDRIVSPVDWTRIANAETYSEVVSALEKTPYEKVAKQWSGREIAEEGLFSLETALDRTWIHLLRSVIDTLPSEDRVLALSVLDRDADLKNSINLVRFGSLYRLSEKQLRTLMLEGGTLLESSEFESYLKSPAEQRSPQLLVARRFPDLAKQLQAMGKASAEMQTRTVEQYLFSVRRTSFQAMLRGNPFSFGIILAYFFLEERQNAMIRTLINGIYYGWDTATIREFAI